MQDNNNNNKHQSKNVPTRLSVHFGGYSSAGLKEENQDAFAAFSPAEQLLKTKGAIAAIAGIYILRPSIAFLNESKRDVAARKLFFASIFYLPALLFPLVLDLWLI